MVRSIPIAVRSVSTNPNHLWHRGDQRCGRISARRRAGAHSSKIASNIPSNARINANRFGRQDCNRARIFFDPALAFVASRLSTAVTVHPQQLSCMVLPHTRARRKIQRPPTLIAAQRILTAMRAATAPEPTIPSANPGMSCHCPCIHNAHRAGCRTTPATALPGGIGGQRFERSKSAVHLRMRGFVPVIAWARTASAGATDPATLGNARGAKDRPVQARSAGQSFAQATALVSPLMVAMFFMRQATSSTIASTDAICAARPDKDSIRGSPERIEHCSAGGYFREVF